MARLLVEGLTNPEIGAHIGRSSGSVRNTIVRMMRMTETRNRVQLALLVERAGGAGQTQSPDGEVG